MFHIVNEDLTINLSRVESVRNMAKYWKSLGPSHREWVKAQLESGRIFQVRMIAPESAPFEKLQFGDIFYLNALEKQILNSALMLYSAKQEEK